MDRKLLITAAIIFCGLGISTAAQADRVEEVWTCKVQEGKSMDDVRAANWKWVKYINANVEGGDISGSIATTIVGGLEMGAFIYVDSFPSLESWAAARRALQKNDEGKAVDAELIAAATCAENRLYSIEKS